MKKTLQECKEIIVKEFNPQNIFPTRKDREDLIDLANKMYYEQSENESKEYKSILETLYTNNMCSHAGDELIMSVLKLLPKPPQK